MVSTLSLVAASVLLGQTTDYPVGPAAPSAKVYVYSNGVLVPYSGPQGATVTQQPVDNHPLLTKIQGWFGKRSTPTNTIPMETAPPPTIVNSPTPKIITMPTTTPQSLPAAPAAVPAADYPRKMPTSLQSPAAGSEVHVTPNAGTVSPAVLSSTLPVPAKSPILPANANRIGRDEKFAWVTGQLEMEKGQYVLYYATPETVDPYHGRIMLNPQRVDLHMFHSGDLVSMRGQLLTGHGTPVYQLTDANLIEKAKR